MRKALQHLANYWHRLSGRKVIYLGCDIGRDGLTNWVRTEYDKRTGVSRLLDFGTFKR